MAHFAKIVNNIVTDVVVVPNEHETNGQDYLNSLGLIGKWVQTSYNANFGVKYAAIGDTYDELANTFKPAKPYASWVWDEKAWCWNAPTLYPADNKEYSWNDSERNWVEILIIEATNEKTIEG